MRTPQLAPIAGMSPLGLTNPRNVDEKTVAERKWTAPLKPKAEQTACDLGLFSDDSKQTELF
jgi:hypothetical protein